jgi:putative flippase GtrA
MGGVTTIIFWGFELSFYYFFESTLMKYVGGGLGLILGYISKYFLDKKFVFTSDG